MTPQVVVSSVCGGCRQRYPAGVKVCPVCGELFITDRLVAVTCAGCGMTNTVRIPREFVAEAKR